MPAAAAGQNIQLRWRFGADSNTAPAGGGWNVDSVQFYGTFACTPAPIAASVSGRVLAYAELGLRNAGVTLADRKGQIFATRTGGRGTFTFRNVPEGSYILSIRSKRFSYAPVDVDVKGSINGIEITPETYRK